MAKYEMLYAVRYTLYAIFYHAIRYTPYDIRSTKDYVRKNNLFMENKANFQKVKLNVNEVLTKDYVQMDTWWSGKNKPNSNPIQSQFKPNQSQNKPNTNPNKPNLKAEYCKFIDDYSFILYTGVLYKKKPNMEKQ